MGGKSGRRFDPEGRKNPEGERRLEAQPINVGQQTSNGLKARKRPVTGRTETGSRAKSRTGWARSRAGNRSGRPGTSTPEWRSWRQGSRCGRAKGRYEVPVQVGINASGAPGSYEP